jgi:1,2-phenylacetyl-CoA epoxidase PaaB subunit
MDKWCGRIVASVAARPDPHNKLYRQIFLLMQAYNAKAFMENADMGFKEYLDRKRATDLWLVESMDFKSDMTQQSNGRRRYGWNPSPENKRFLLGLVKNYMRQEFVILDENGEEKTVLGVQMINDIGLLDEIISYKKDNNVDRITSFMSCLGYEFYLFNNYMLPVLNSRKTNKEENTKKQPEKSLAERLYGASSRPKKYF